MVFGAGKKLEFRDYVQGTWGVFNTPAGQVSYVLTKARLGEDSAEPERQLTKSLSPVREIMEPDSLDFNQLLQRDLDDHRVAIKLIPYLLEKKPTGPAFFPPIVAILLPFKNKKPTKFPALGASSDTVDDDGTRWREEKAGSAFKVQQLLDVDGRLHPVNVGKLWWNSTEAKLVVLDGQHRAMALLAIERTLSNSWADSTGAKYRSFYENEVTKQLKKGGQGALDLASIEVPVAVCWLPAETGENARAHEAARKLFVDVNREARPPSESRIILLSDAELTNILTRRMLSELRSDDTDRLLPLIAVEYDNPIVNTSRPARWSVVTNIHLLKEAVDWCIFGPAKLLSNVDVRKSRGRPNKIDRDACMREQLQTDSLFPNQFEDGGYTYRRDELGNEDFPLGQVDKISDRFAATWGESFLLLLSSVRPYSAHVDALQELKDNWHRDETSLTLAYDALFGGVGVYWTLKDSYEHYLSNGAKGQKSDVVVAWEAILKREGVFESYRANQYMGGASDGLLKKSKAAYAVLNTQACQLGLLLSLGTLWELRKDANAAVLDELPILAAAMVDGLNNYFDQDHGKAADRRLALNKAEVTHPLNQIQNMDALQAVYFRYFWLEILSSDAVWPHIAAWVPDKVVFDQKRNRGRSFYFNLLSEQHLKALATSNPGQAAAGLKNDAEAAAKKSLQRALAKWCAVDESEFSQWFDNRTDVGDSTQPDDDGVTKVRPEDDLSDDNADGAVTSLEELLGD
ncbi:MULTISPECIES: DNA sulfur modification protein DndB [Mycobacterium]|uniref:DGQHR domain-containing protein n=1 Tax=Mycobacterium syngnathidarum TaxID=1908205 RepID=A0A1S1JYA0_9MYCO|nr:MULTISPECIES: DNA sulfur modification protein DndB [Mycobacterium]MCG7607946.1 hypothetical protein [Mycobacterium sp. CnD-18-1]OHT93326.1 hypothetical protein BKG61_22365 [Mycobacterium syngnathidarum]OLT88097.1 hypothetical protein BKG60_27560 [Mycobacterium syngnathidarum]